MSTKQGIAVVAVLAMLTMVFHISKKTTKLSASTNEKKSVYQQIENEEKGIEN